MKYIVISLFVALFGLQQTKAQDPISVGQIEFDGIKKVKRGAFWNSRPEAKEVFEKGYSTRKDVIVYKTTEVYLARFKDDEHNSQDGNYLAIPIGFTFYTKGSDPFPYDPECGNQFKYFKPLSQIKIINVPTPPATACENHLKLKIYRWIDQNNQVVKSDSLVYEGFTSQSCKNIVDTSLFTTKVVVEKQQIEADDYEVEEKVGSTTINNYTTNIYNQNQSQRGGRYPVYRQQEVRRSGFRIFVGYRGGGNISNPVPVINPRYDPSGLGGGGTRYDPPGNGVRPRQVFDPAGIGG